MVKWTKRIGGSQPTAPEPTTVVLPAVGAEPGDAVLELFDEGTDDADELRFPTGERLLHIGTGRWSAETAGAESWKASDDPGRP